MPLHSMSSRQIPTLASYPATEMEIEEVKRWMAEMQGLEKSPFRHINPPEGYAVEMFLEDLVLLSPVLMSRAYERESPFVKGIVDRAGELLHQIRREKVTAKTAAKVEYTDESGNKVWIDRRATLDGVSDH